MKFIVGLVVLVGFHALKVGEITFTFSALSLNTKQNSFFFHFVYKEVVREVVDNMEEEEDMSQLRHPYCHTGGQTDKTFQSKPAPSP